MCRGADGGFFFIRDAARELAFIFLNEVGVYIYIYADERKLHKKNGEIKKNANK